MKNFLLSFLAFAALLTANPQPVYACSCIIPGTPAEEMEKSDAVFSGEVIKIEDSYNYGYDVTLQVLETWKGTEGSLIKVHTGMGGGDCGFGFKEGEEYLVYASLTDGELQVYSCSLTGILDESDTESLGEGTPVAESERPPEWMYAAATLAVILSAVFFALMSQKKRASRK